jgi:DNA-binding response OmpR family regulator
VPLTYQQKKDLSVKETNQIKKPKVLIVDDNEEFLEELKEMLSFHGFNIETVSDCERALSVAYEMKPDVVLLDLKMAPKSGFQVADELKHSLKFGSVPVVAMTGFFTEKEHVLMMKLCGINAFILKPFSPQALISKLESALGRTSNNESADAT